MSDILGEDFMLDLDDILDAEVIEDTSSTEDKGGSGNPDAQLEEPNGNPDDIDMSAAFAEPKAEVEETEEIENENEEQNEEPAERTPDEGSSSSTIASYASALFEQGAFPDIDESEIKAVKTTEDLISLNRKQIEANELRDLTPLQREALEAFRAGINPEQFAQVKSREVLYDNITEDSLKDNDKAKEVIKDYLTMNGTPEDVISDLIESYDIDEKLEAKAKDALPKIKAKIKEQNENEIRAARESREALINDIKSSLDKTKVILPGTNISDKERSELFNQMTKPAKVLDDGTQLDYVMLKRQEDPMGFMMKLHYYAKLGLFDKEVKTEILKTKAKTDALKDFESKLNQGNSSTNLRGGNTNPKSKATDLYDFDEIPNVNPYK